MGEDNSLDRGSAAAEAQKIINGLQTVADADIGDGPGIGGGPGIEVRALCWAAARLLVALRHELRNLRFPPQSERTAAAATEKPAKNGAHRHVYDPAGKCTAPGCSAVSRQAKRAAAELAAAGGAAP